MRKLVLYLNGKKFDPLYREVERERKLKEFLDNMPMGRYLTTNALAEKLGYRRKGSWMSIKKFPGYCLRWNYRNTFWGNKRSIALLKRQKDELESSPTL